MYDKKRPSSYDWLDPDFRFSWHHAAFVLVAWGVVSSMPVAAQEAPAATPPATETVSAEQAAAPGPSQQFIAMQRLAGQTTVVILDETGEHSAELRAEPVMKYGDETRNIKESTLWIWMDGPQPVAIQKIEVNTWNGPDRAFWTYCIGSLSDRPLRISWPFRAEPFLTVPLTFHKLEAAPPGQDDRVLQLQMRNVIRGFSVSEGNAKRMEELRLLPQPISQIGAAGEFGRGAIFGFAVGTNPDVHVILRTAGATGQPAHWESAVARMTSAGVIARFKDHELYNTPNERPGYHETWGYFFTSAEFPKEQ
jgi:hypothetical protein